MRPGGGHCNKFVQDVNALGKCHPRRLCLRGQSGLGDTGRGHSTARTNIRVEALRGSQGPNPPLGGYSSELAPTTYRLNSAHSQSLSSPTAPTSAPPRLPYPNPRTSFANARGCCCVGGTAGYYRAPVRGRCQGAVTPAHGTPPARMYQGKCDGGEGRKNGFCIGRSQPEWTAIAKAQAEAKAIRCHSLQPVRGGSYSTCKLTPLLGGWG